MVVQTRAFRDRFGPPVARAESRAPGGLELPPVPLALLETPRVDVAFLGLTHSQSLTHTL